ncbi:glycoprotein endo-alpha-1,2-mannosidase-like isoform X2 [Scyliorhinus canicula]|uniref:glycoprotein endo-alpha-1,2-mannosidase-like isoform X2 n=1 Tax=Scyliorhinus canicula TaxID=7830 RepID=UPI0018F7316A|nr:glycoprotein endo-alpha-1,2-mannosidase-like isoform X2 [Scyliorhinus canicula]XP_038655492.1 glycoprotein endo-alpha-1,2-mannosidase-like isoform X2 [Scyliorhinus canicula]XP_038655493.1 glycoprotein endo-alpha-1,2-mannosidase-like isoform X2 [Scyliorhinus canicula]
MARFRRKTWITLLLFILFVFGVMMGLKTLRPEGAGFGDGVGLELLPQLRPRADVGERRADLPKVEKSRESGTPRDSKMNDHLGVTKRTPISDTNLDQLPPVNYDLHAFYYSWYGNQQFDGKYIHWNHPLVPHWDPKIASSYPKGRHIPPEDIGANFYPELGAYSSRDPAVLNAHMKQLRAAAIGVMALSWYPPGMSDENGEPTEDLVPVILEAAHKYQLKFTFRAVFTKQPAACLLAVEAVSLWNFLVSPLSTEFPGDSTPRRRETCVPAWGQNSHQHEQSVIFHIEPYEGRENTLYNNLKYIIDKYGSHPAFYRYKTSAGRNLPMFYIYDSYLISPGSWANLLSVSGSRSLRNTQYDALFIALIVEEKHKNEILQAGFDGMYTYFATNGFSHGSSHHNWQALKDFCDSNNLMFIPSVGPGYIDTSIRAWNNHNTRNRVNGKYYETALSTALLVRPEIITITSFNEWHEGTQIEMSVPKKSSQLVYLDYLPHKPDIYLELTRKWAEKFRREKEQWLM